MPSLPACGSEGCMVDRDKDVDDQMVYDGIRSELGDFETFVEYVLAYMDQ
jgi:uncharacterized protein YutE (UPF0331/DUF86 family)